jgi:hypothetical protein
VSKPGFLRFGPTKSIGPPVGMTRWANRALRMMFLDGGGHEAEDKDAECEQGAETPIGIKRHGIIDGRRAKETETQENPRPNVPARPMLEETESDKNEWE